MTDNTYDPFGFGQLSLDAEESADEAPEVSPAAPPVPAEPASPEPATEAGWVDAPVAPELDPPTAETVAEPPPPEPAELAPVDAETPLDDEADATPPPWMNAAPKHQVRLDSPKDSAAPSRRVNLHALRRNTPPKRSGAVQWGTALTFLAAGGAGAAYFQLLEQNLVLSLLCGGMGLIAATFCAVLFHR